VTPVDGPGGVGAGPGGTRALVGTAAALAARPWLWATALRQGLVLAPPGWWRRRPFLPRPDPAYLAFRLQTMYGDPRHPLRPADVVAYLRWCRRYRRTRPSGSYGSYLP
jgi:hypothetical protein